VVLGTLTPVPTFQLPEHKRLSLPRSRAVLRHTTAAGPERGDGREAVPGVLTGLADPRSRRLRLFALPLRGRAAAGHHQLTDCWVCWSDVHQGHCALEEILHPDAWDLFAVAELEVRSTEAPGLRLVEGH
jgi:hypothetical protein